MRLRLHPRASRAKRKCCAGTGGRGLRCCNSHGASRISSLRKEAATRGLDPNVWFQNVEYVAGEKLGQETVTYVSNIYKYYVSYRLALQQIEARQRARRF